MIRVTVWNENFHEVIRKQEDVLAVYPQGIHGYLASILQDEFSVKTVTLCDQDGNLNENAGITQQLLEDTDVMIWWSHIAQPKVPDEAAQMVADAVRRGMGIIFLHSAHLAKPFRLLVGTSGILKWREDDDWERLWVVSPAHPIAQGLAEYIRIPKEEVYGEPFGIPEPDELVFIGAYEGGEVFRSGCCWKREYGKIFYFQPGHETYPTYYIPEIQRVIKNAIYWAYSPFKVPQLKCAHITKPQD